LELGSAGDPSISDELIASNERLIELLDLIDRQWGALFDRKVGGVTLAANTRKARYKLLRRVADGFPGLGSVR
jgi:hypothetical protein